VVTWGIYKHRLNYPFTHLYLFALQRLDSLNIYGHTSNLHRVLPLCLRTSLNYPFAHLYLFALQRLDSLNIHGHTSNLHRVLAPLCPDFSRARSCWDLHAHLLLDSSQVISYAPRVGLRVRTFGTGPKVAFPIDCSPGFTKFSCWRNLTCISVITWMHH